MFDVKSLFDYHEDGFLIWKLSPSNNVKIGDVAGCLCKRRGYFVVHINDKQYLLHRMIYLWHYGILPDLLDHIDQNPLNNRIENLRESDKLHNGHNRKANKNSQSGIKGVCFDKSRNKWKAQIQIGDKRFSKRFSEETEAIEWLTLLREEHL